MPLPTLFPLAQPDLLEAGKDDCQTSRWTTLVSNWNPATSTKQKGYRKQGRPAKRWEDDLNINLQPDRSTSDWTWLTIAEGRSTWDAMESDFVSSKLKQPARPTTPYHHDCDNPTNNARRYATHSLSIKLNLRHTKATTQAHVSVTHLLPSTDARPLHSKRQEI